MITELATIVDSSIAGGIANNINSTNHVFVKGNRIYCTSGNDNALSIFRLIKHLFN